MLSCARFSVYESPETSLQDVQDEGAGFKELTELARQYYNNELKEIMETARAADPRLLSFAKEMSVKHDFGHVDPARVYASWDKAVTAKVGNGVPRTEVPVSYSSRIVSLIKVARDSVGEEPDQSMLSKIFDRLVIFHEKDGFTQKIIRFHPDKSYLKRHDFDASHNYLHKLDRDFSGYLEYLEVTGERRAIIRVVDAKPVRMSVRRGQGGNRLPVAVAAAGDSTVTTM